MTNHCYRDFSLVVVPGSGIMKDGGGSGGGLEMRAMVVAERTGRERIWVGCKRETERERRVWRRRG